MMSAKGGFVECVQYVLDHNPNINAVDKDGFSALTLAAKAGHTDIVQLLIQCPSVYINLPDKVDLH